jgi:hypothetical protein
MMKGGGRERVDAERRVDTLGFIRDVRGVLKIKELDQRACTPCWIKLSARHAGSSSLHGMLACHPSFFLLLLRVVERRCRTIVFFSCSFI